MVKNKIDTDILKEAVGICLENEEAYLASPLKERYDAVVYVCKCLERIPA